MNWLENAAYWFGFGAGAEGMRIALNSGEESYRKKYFDVYVQNDLKAIAQTGRLEEIAYPFPNTVKTKRPPFFVRHKFYCGGLVVLWGTVMLLANAYEMFGEMALKIAAILGIVTMVFTNVGFIILLIKKLARGGKKVVDFTLQGTCISEGQQYWNVREQVRKALQAGTISAQDAIYHIRNTSLGRRVI